MQKKTMILMGVLIGASILGSMGMLIGPSAATTGDVVDVPVYAVGDYWDYNYTIPEGVNYTIHHEVTNIGDHQDYWNETYECYRISRSVDEIVDVEENNTAHISMNGDIYEKTADLFGIESTIETNATFSGDNSFEYSSQQNFMRNSGNSSLFPLNLGNEFIMTYDLISTVILNLNGNEHILAFEQAMEIQYTVSISDILIPINTPAGTFECVKITYFTESQNSNGTTVRYYSAEVGREIKVEMTYMSIGFPVDVILIQGYELLEYHFGPSFSIPGYSCIGFFSLIGVTSLIIIGKGKIKKNTP